jgi:hypothetical protein
VELLHPDGAERETQAALEKLYVERGYAIAPSSRRSCCTPTCTTARRSSSRPQCTPPGCLRARNQTIVNTAWAWLGSMSGQMLFRPPNVSGWNDQAWLDTSTLRGRWLVINEVLRTEYVTPTNTYDQTETPQTALDRALQFWGRPTLTQETRDELLRYAAAAIPAATPSWHVGYFRAQRQNALRHLIAMSPDFQTC